MADETISNNDSLPPKVNLQNTDALKAGSGNAASSAAKPITLKARPASKSETAKIPLDVASSGISISNDTPQTKTIKIKPVAVPGTIKMGATAPAVATPQAVKAAKSQTSKIPLDAVMPTGSADPDSGPKTIRLKRPGATSTPVAMPAQPTVARIAKDVKSDLSKTSRLDLDDAGIDAPTTPTRRKTIRVKRPTSGTTPSLDISRSKEPASDGGALPTVGAPVPPMPIEEVEEKSLISGIASILALFVVCTLIYVLMAQVTGKNGSLSELSYFMPEVNLSWPGRIPAN